MMPKFLYRSEFYFLIVLFVLLGLQFSMFSQSRDEFKMIKGYEVVNQKLTKDNKTLEDKVNELQANLKKTDEENQELLGEIYEMNRATKAKKF